MRILVTNDDGIHAPGLGVAERIAAALSDDVWIVAPETDQSGVSHSLTLNDPLRLREVEARRFAIKGTPTDCVIMGLRHVLRDVRPDLVLSGVNRGQNVAEDVTYSGTVAGAMEGTILGVPSIALSQAYGPGGRNAPGPAARRLSQLEPRRLDSRAGCQHADADLPHQSRDRRNVRRPHFRLPRKRPAGNAQLLLRSESERRKWWSRYRIRLAGRKIVDD